MVDGDSLLWEREAPISYPSVLPGEVCWGDGDLGPCRKHAES